MNHIEVQYLNLLNQVFHHGHKTTDRTGTGTLSVFGHQIRHDMSYGFPLLTTKKVFWRGVVEELLWMLRGETNIKSLQEKGIKIWDQWADKKGELGPVYGAQWRRWIKKKELIDGTGSDYDGTYDIEAIDQIANVIQRIKTKPDCRRLIVSAWNVAEIEHMHLAPCHCFFQFKVYGNKLNLQLYQRSADLFLGVPFNIASYALLLHIVAKATGLQPGEFIHTFGDAHIYLNHTDQVMEQMSRQPYTSPTIEITKNFSDPAELTFEDFILKDYLSHPPIKGAVSV